MKERIAILEHVRPLLCAPGCVSRAQLMDTRDGEAFENVAKFDFVVTSPPYATALPYIDTQRLSSSGSGLLSQRRFGISKQTSSVAARFCVDAKNSLMH